jgi:hypothetical protein
MRSTVRFKTPLDDPANSAPAGFLLTKQNPPNRVIERAFDQPSTSVVLIVSVQAREIFSALVLPRT